MFKKTVYFLLLLVGFTVLISFSVSAECNHNFEAAEGNSNLIYNYNFSHSYYCLNGCGSFGTVSGGINSVEKCTFHVVSGEEATCISTGKMVYMCTVCFRSKEEITEIADHKYVLTIKLPTCTREGYERYDCAVCNDSYIRKRTNTISHIPDGGIIEIKPTYEKDGVLKISCRVCDRLLERKAIPKLVEPKANYTVKKVSGLKLKSVYATSVKLTWNKLVDATVYKVYYSTDKKHWQVKTTKNAYISVGKLDSAKMYYFKVNAIIKGYESKTSKIISVCTKPLRATITVFKSSKKAYADIEWKALDNVSGYELSYSRYPFNKNKGIKTVNVTKGNRKRLSGLKSGKKYYFRVRGYKNIGNNKIFGTYSKVKRVKIK